jgi:hypothetical protein
MLCPMSLVRFVDLSLCSTNHRYLKKLTIKVSRFRKRDVTVLRVFVDSCVFAPFPFKDWACDLAIEDDV